MDDEILKTVHSLFGPGVNVVDCEKVSTVAQEEVLLLNGIPLKLDEMSFDDATAIRAAFKEGQMPSVDLLNELLTHAGIINQSVQLETSLSVKSSLVTKEEVLVSKHGKVLDERTTETKEDYVLKSNTIEQFHPICKTRIQDHANYKLEPRNSSTSKSSVELDDGAYYSSDRIRKCTSNENSNSNLYGDKCSSNAPSLSTYDKYKNLSSTISNCSTYTCSKLSDDYLKNSDKNISEIKKCSTNLKNLSFDDSGHEETLLSSASEYPRVRSKGHMLQLNDVFTENNIGKDESNVHAESNSILNTQVLTFNNGKLVSGSLENITKHWCRNGYTLDKEFIITFVICCRKFYSARQMLSICIKTWKDQQGREFDTRKMGGQGLQLLHQWFILFPHDFQDDIFLKEVKSWMQLSIAANKKFYGDALELAKNIAVQYKMTINSLEEFFSKFTGQEKSFPTGLLDSILSDTSLEDNNIKEKSEGKTMKKNTIFQVISNPFDLVHHLTATEFQYMSKIEIEALIYYVDESLTDIVTTEFPFQYTHIISYKDWFDHFKKFVVTEIVKAVKKKHRILVVDLWIDVACELFKIGNFNSLMAIISALHSPSVSRLKKTWSKVQTAKFSVLNNQMDSDSDFGSYRILLNMKAATCCADNGKIKNDHVLVPYFDLFIQDLMHLMEKYSKRLPNGLVNFEGCSTFAGLLTEFNKWKHLHYPYERNTLLDLYIFNDNNTCDEKMSLKQSFACEPPGSEDERSTYKALKINLK